MLVQGKVRRRTQRERSDVTQAALVGAARDLFASGGYHATPAEEIVRKAGVTSGALYHHFGDKRGLFRAAFDAVERSLAERVRQAAVRGKNPWARLGRGVSEELRAGGEPETRQLGPLDRPPLPGWGEARRADPPQRVRAL